MADGSGEAALRARPSGVRGGNRGGGSGDGADARADAGRDGGDATGAAPGAPAPAAQDLQGTGSAFLDSVLRELFSPGVSGRAMRTMNWALIALITMLLVALLWELTSPSAPVKPKPGSAGDFVTAMATIPVSVHYGVMLFFALGLFLSANWVLYELSLAKKPGAGEVADDAGTVVDDASRGADVGATTPPAAIAGAAHAHSS